MADPAGKLQNFSLFLSLGLSLDFLKNFLDDDPDQI